MTTTTNTTTSFNVGVRLGRAIGWTSAQVVQRSIGAAEATGDFGRGVKAGTEQQYRSTTCSIAAARALKYQALAAAMAPQAEKAPVSAPAAAAPVAAAMFRGPVTL